MKVPAAKLDRSPPQARANCNAEAGHESSERGGLDPEIAQERDDKNDVERDGDECPNVADDRRLHLFLFERAREEPGGKADQLAADDEGNNRPQHLLR